MAQQIQIDKVSNQFGKNISNWAKSSAAYCLKMNIVKGSSGKLRPKEYMTRAETAVLINKMLLSLNLI
ncbi:S-layer homology domain-containing protein [Anaerovorax odorimutans]|uniref:S-layer homology domain-containing protein n=1 Tax=Anaerovorax odorimutans TaxID=109327 RepID=UPI0003FB0691|nr:S-layer homology domain-containing protein [Anaerovorax odorimutans]